MTYRFPEPERKAIDALAHDDTLCGAECDGYPGQTCTRPPHDGSRHWNDRLNWPAA